MNAFKCLFTLQWLTGEDGRVSFSKLVLVVVLGFETLLMVYLVRSDNLVAALWPLVWLFALTIAGSHGIKGLQLWFRSAQLRTQANTQSAIINNRRDSDLNIEPS
jgi:hypothetical protein